MSIIYPMGLLAIFTLLYSSVLITVRKKAVASGDIKPSYFKEYNNDTPPSYMQKATRQWSNLYEVPVLFYAVCAAILALRLDDMIFTYMAYSFFGLRLVQSFIHTTYNNVYHRLLIFSCGMVTVLAMWVRLLLNVDMA
ncbi:MAG: MAPEG family protein [Emcibacter sp.]|nr:MAPEG family protein [Emcibacter sp.]MBL4894329.1 MAPEG family protein [Emcibacter sp.]